MLEIAASAHTRLVNVTKRVISQSESYSVSDQI